MHSYFPRTYWLQGLQSTVQETGDMTALVSLEIFMKELLDEQPNKNVFCNPLQAFFFIQF